MPGSPGDRGPEENGRREMIYIFFTGDDIAGGATPIG